MPLDFKTANDRRMNLKYQHATGAPVTTPNGRAWRLMGPALHSETLECLLVLFDPEGSKGQGDWLAVAPGALRPAQEAPDLPSEAASYLDLSVFRHAKGGLYTRLAQARGLEGALTLYASHADGIWWLRPQSMFEDGRFTPDPEAPLSAEALDL